MPAGVWGDDGASTSTPTIWWGSGPGCPPGGVVDDVIPNSVHGCVIACDVIALTDTHAGCSAVPIVLMAQQWRNPISPFVSLFVSP